ncbi:sugar phosphate isomerase/epimerase family protein [Frigidibacter sp. MR17.14]|uniref:sugar phosphate isomerase/epimerase family protein n=1 Tax=Frigidibacter sp. MR17.14 TaxID=3126509 RepID=UPI003012EF1F
MTWTAETWPIAAAMLPFPGLLPDGTAKQDADPAVWAADLAEVAGAGFTAVDPTDSWISVAALDAARRAAFLEICRDLGLSVPAISTSRKNLVDPLRGPEMLAYAHRVIDCAAEIGAQAVSFGFFGALTPAQLATTWFWTAQGQPLPVDPETRALAVERTRELGRHGAEVGVEVALEMYEDTYVGTARDAVAFVEDVDHPSVRLNVDIGNLVRLHRPVEPWAEMIRLCAPHAGYWHLKNYARMEDAATGTVLTHPAPLLGGTINWRAAIRSALGHGFASPFLLEHYGGDGLGVCAENQTYLRQVLAASLSRAAV